MTAITAPVTPKPRAKRLPLALIVNLAVAVLLLASLPVIYKGRQGFVPHAELDKDYVNAAIASGEAEFMHAALKTTETARAMAHESHLSTMSLLQLAVLALVVLFVFNSLSLYRNLREPSPVPPGS